ncbi:MAG: GntR family transcriptional regulator, partial [Planctomycetota bacterium]
SAEAGDGWDGWDGVPGHLRPRWAAVRIPPGKRGRVLRWFLAAVQRGEFAPGERLPGERKVAAALGVGRDTVRAAMRELAAAGWVVAGRRGQGLSVAERVAGKWTESGREVVGSDAAPRPTRPPQTDRCGPGDRPRGRDASRGPQRYTEAMKTRKGLALATGLMALACGGGGCVQRTIHVTSEPAGALVWLNDEEVGRTPVAVPFTFYGTYDVRLEKDGFAPLWTTGEAEMPWWEAPGPDLFAELIPGAESNVAWHYELEAATPAADVDTEALRARARELRNQTRGFETDRR